ncbi:hypothetical protein BaRGS_00035006, partial [Batillaria attramentaria]
CETRCEAPAVHRGDPAYITCYFDFNISQTPKNFELQKYNDTNDYEDANDNTVVVVAVSVCAGIVMVGLTAVLIFICWRKRRVVRREVLQRLLHQTTTEINSTETLPYDHDTFDKALNMLREEGAVIIVGPEKCGKTTIGRALQRFFRDKRYTPLDLVRPNSWNHCKRIAEKLVVLLDEIFRPDETVEDMASWSSVFKFMKQRRCLIIVIIKANTRRSVQHNLPSFMEDFPKVFAANDGLRNELFRVCLTGDLKCLQGLLHHGVNVNAVNDKGKTPLHIAVYRTTATNLPGEERKRVSVQGESHGQTAAKTGACARREGGQHLLVAQGDEFIALLLAAGANPDAVDDKGRTPLHVACHEGNCTAVVSLLNAGPNTDARDQDGRTALHLACQVGDAITIKRLPSNATNTTQWSPLRWSSGNDKAVDLLLKAGANIEAKDGRGIRALHLASRGGNEKIIQILLKYGADVSATTQDGQTPSDIATRYDHQKVAEWLKQAEGKLRRSKPSFSSAEPRPAHV